MDESVRGLRDREDLPAELSLEDKISLLTGADYWSLHGHPGIGLRPTWAIEPGDFHLHIGRSSRDVPLPVTVTASSGTDMPGGTPGGSRC